MFGAGRADCAASVGTGTGGGGGFGRGRQQRPRRAVDRDTNSDAVEAIDGYGGYGDRLPSMYHSGCFGNRRRAVRADDRVWGHGFVAL